MTPSKCLTPSQSPPSALRKGDADSNAELNDCAGNMGTDAWDAQFPTPPLEAGDACNAQFTPPLDADAFNAQFTPPRMIGRLKMTAAQPMNPAGRFPVGSTPEDQLLANPKVKTSPPSTRAVITPKAPGRSNKKKQFGIAYVPFSGLTSAELSRFMREPLFDNEDPSSATQPSSSSRPTNIENFDTDTPAGKTRPADCENFDTNTPAGKTSRAKRLKMTCEAPSSPEAAAK